MSDDRARPEISSLSRAELDQLVAWAAEEGWNPGRNDAACFWAADPEGFIALRDGAELLGGGAIVSYGGRFGFVGLFIVRSDLRGGGLGRALWEQMRETLLNRLEPGAAIGLDGVLAMEGFYAADGFRTSHRHRRMAGTGAPAASDAALQPLSALPFELVAELDRECFGFDRSGFLRPWLDPPGGLGLGLIEDEHLRGYGVARPCGEGFKIGPLFAADDDVAGRILAGLGTRTAGEPIFLDVPDVNPKALALAAGLGMEEVFACARMYLGEPPALPWERIFGATTLELG